MPSLDFVYDITEKLDEEKIDYLVLTIREHRVESKVDVFFNVSQSRSNGEMKMRIEIDVSACNDWYIEEIIDMLKTKVLASKIKKIDELGRVVE